MRRSLYWLAPLGAVALVLALGAIHLASSRPDGLERVAQTQGFDRKERTSLSAPMPDYEISRLGSGLGKTAAGLLGVALTFGLVLGVGSLLARRRSNRRSSEPEHGPACGKRP